MASHAAISSLLGVDCKRELVAHQIDSYDDFVLNRISDVVDGFNPIKMHSTWIDGGSEFTLQASITVTNPVVTSPSATEHDGTIITMTPDVARSRHFSYSSDLLADIEVDVLTTRDGNEQAEFNRVFRSVKIGRLPVMVYSCACTYGDPAARIGTNMCPQDPGGYFILGGNERVIVPQDRMSENRIFVFPVNKTVSYTCAAEARSLVSERFGVPKLTMVKISAKANSGGHFAHVTMHHVSSHIPIFAIMRALGMTTDAELFRMLHGDHFHGKAICRFLAGCAQDCLVHGISTKESACAWIAARCQTIQTTGRDVGAMLETELLPHVKPTIDGQSRIEKCLVLADMARRAALVAMGVARMDDRDSYVNKRVDPAGILLANLFRQVYGKFAKEARKALAKDFSTRIRVAHKDLANAVNISTLAKPSIIEQGMRMALATGNWGVKNNAKVGVSQILSRMTYSATLSHLRRVCTSIDKTSKLVMPRKLHGSQWGIFCPAETPEGHSVGVVKNMSLGVRVSLPVDPQMCIQLIVSGACGEVQPLDSYTQHAQDTQDTAVICVNYSPTARTCDPWGCAKALRKLRRGGCLHPHTSIVYDADHKQVRVLMDGGRMVRPLFVVRDGAIVKVTGERECVSWTDYIMNGAVEYLDVEEAATSMISMSHGGVTRKSTHCEIHPALALGVLASMIPFPHHNQSPRNSYQSAMGKQAVGVYASNFRRRFDTHAMVLECPQKPIISTMSADLLRLDDLPNGCNLIVAVSTMAGYNQEDSVVLNKSSLERGMFATTVYHTIYEQIHKNSVTGEEEIFYAPDASDVPLSTFNFSKLLPHGLPKMGTRLTGGDVIIGKYMPQKGGGFTDESVALRSTESGKLDCTVASRSHGRKAVNGDGYSFVQVKLRDARRPTIGDKVASRAGQKGTVGMVLRQEDMPTTATGLVPDLIINPHALPSRMTVGQLLEGVLGKACCMSGCSGDSTPFDASSATSDEVFDALSRVGAECHGEEVMYDPRTGHQEVATMFVTPTFYQRLKHMVVDKVHGRGSSGPMVFLTRQPAEGRARDGGLRVGEMEIECLLAHGNMKFLKERFMRCSDRFEVCVCASCGALATVNISAKVHHCHKCGNIQDFWRCEIPYAMKLMMQETDGLGVSMSMLR
jgi:DNA-directed RNA polymerase II subunit RPB2